MDSSQRPLEKLVDIVARLRGPDGCPWDKEQTLQSMRPYLLEEVYELLEVMEHDAGADGLDEYLHTGERVLPWLYRRHRLEDAGLSKESRKIWIGLQTSGGPSSPAWGLLQRQGDAPGPGMRRAPDGGPT